MMAPTVSHRVLIRFESVVNDRTDGGVSTDRRHATAQRSVITREKREFPAGARTCFVHRTEITVQEYASAFGLTQDRLPVLRIGDRVLPENLCGRHVQVSGQFFYVGAGNVHAGLAATVGASSAVYLCLHFASNPSKQKIGRMVSFEKSAKVEILFFLPLSEAPDLNEVGNHG
jgi:hypothetical protein